MKYERLGNLVNILSGFAFDSKLFSEETGVPLVRIRDVLRGYSSTFYSGIYDDKYVIQNGDVLIGMDGEFNIAKWNGGHALLNQRVCKVIPVSAKVDSSYLFRFLPKELKRIEDSTPFVTVKHLSVKTLQEIEIPLLSLAEQKRIAEVLDIADTVREKRRLAFQKLNTLPQSVFLEMFGDPVTNPKGWDLVELGSIVLNEKGSIMRGPFGGAIKKDCFVPEGFKIYEQKNAIRNDFTIGSYFINQSKFNELKRFSVLPDDLIISCSGTVGKIAIAPKNTPSGIINQALMKIRVDKNIALPIFVKSLLETDKYQSDLFGSARGVAIKNVKPLKEVKQTSIVLPPIDAQKKYEQFVGQLRGLENKLMESTKQINNLFQSLQQRAFKGELFNEEPPAEPQEVKVWQQTSPS